MHAGLAGEHRDEGPEVGGVRDDMATFAGATGRHDAR